MRLLPVAGLFVLAPFCAELLSGYQGPALDVVGLLVLVLFAADAAARGRVGLVQAGLIDQCCTWWRRSSTTTSW